MAEIAKKFDIFAKIRVFTKFFVKTVQLFPLSFFLEFLKYFFRNPRQILHRDRYFKKSILILNKLIFWRPKIVTLWSLNDYLGLPENDSVSL